MVGLVQGGGRKCKQVYCDPTMSVDKVARNWPSSGDASVLMEHPIKYFGMALSTQIIIPQKQVGRWSDNTM